MTRRRSTRASNSEHSRNAPTWLPWLVAVFLGLGWLSSVHPEWTPWQAWAQRVGLAATPRQAMIRQWRSTGFDTTDIGKQWLQAAELAMERLNSSPRTLPISQTLYFSFQPQAYLFPIAVGRGRVLVLSVEEELSGGAALVELYQGTTFETLLEAKPVGRDSLRLFVEEDSQFLVRVEVPPLSIGAVAIRISSEPSLSVFPVKGAGRKEVGSVWGDPRDGGARKHEGIDIFSKKGTPLLAAASGQVTRVEEGGLGGKTVWIDIEHPKASLYYAHLEKQLVYEGQIVQEGHEIGLMGNTGNAINTPPHLHFGIYTMGRAIDPLPFVVPGEKAAYPSPESPVGMEARLSSKTSGYPDATATVSTSSLSAKQHLQVLKAAGKRLYVKPIASAETWVDRSAVEYLTAGKLIQVKSTTPLFEYWNGTPYQVGRLEGGEELRYLAAAPSGHTLVQTSWGVQGWIK